MLFLIFFYLCNVYCYTQTILNKKIKFYSKKKIVKYEEENNYTNFKPRTENQQNLVNILDNKNNTIVFIIGPPGSGKTLFSVIKSINVMKEYEKIILVKPIVSVGEDLGFLPGSVNKKMEPFVKNIFDIFEYFFSRKKIENYINSGVIEISPLSFLRGKTFLNSFIIVDEVSNITPHQLKTLLTRIGENTRMILTGDLDQSDLLIKNGLEDFLNKYNKYMLSNNINNISFVYLNQTDIVRSSLITTILDIYKC
jgi:phosphate starvation-inducible PhoH-like protein